MNNDFFFLDHWWFQSQKLMTHILIFRYIIHVFPVQNRPQKATRHGVATFPLCIPPHFSIIIWWTKFYIQLGLEKQYKLWCRRLNGKLTKKKHRISNQSFFSPSWWQIQINFVGCRNTSVIRSDNSVAWNSNYCDGDGGSCSAGWNSSCDGGDGDSGCSRRQKAGAPWKMAAAGRTPPPLLRARCAVWSHTK